MLPLEKVLLSSPTNEQDQPPCELRRIHECSDLKALDQHNMEGDSEELCARVEAVRQQQKMMQTHTKS